MDWPIPPAPVPTSAPTVKTEAPSQVAAIPRVMEAPRQAARNCTWGPHCPISKNEEEHGEEDWDGDLQNQPRIHPQNLQPQTTQNPKLQDFQCQQPQTLQAEKRKLPATSAPATTTKLPVHPAKG